MYEHLVNEDNLGPQSSASGSNVHYEEWLFVLTNDLSSRPFVLQLSSRQSQKGYIST